MAYTYKVLEQCQVHPQLPKSPSTTSLDLTILDIPFLRMLQTVKRLYFYEFPHSTQHFTQNFLPNLKQSLSLTLQTHFPFAGTLLCPTHPHKPRVVCSDSDFVSLQALESQADFGRLSGDLYGEIRHVDEFDHLIARLSPSRYEEGTDVFLLGILGLRVTVFPNSGVCIGVSYRHVVDGRTVNKFMKSWALLQRGEFSCLGDGGEFMPVFDRTLIEDPSGLERVLMEQYYKLRSTWKLDALREADSIHSSNVRATFLLTRQDIETLRELIYSKCGKDSVSTPKHFSKLILSCGLVWSCLIKALELTDSPKIAALDGEDLLHFGLPASVQTRLVRPIPENYFGNCLTILFARVKKKELVTAEKSVGFVAAVKALDKAMTEMKRDPFEGIESRISASTKLFETGRLLAVTGSPNLGVYGTDFGMGRAKNVEVVHFFDATCFSVAESRESGCGGFEIGLALNESAMMTFSSLLSQVVGEKSC